MAFPLTHSKSHNEVVTVTHGNHLIDCFKRFTFKSRSKKKLLNFGFVPRPAEVNVSLNIDQKRRERQFGSSPNVNNIKLADPPTNVVRFRNNSRPPVGMNQSCYGDFMVRNTDDYDNMSEFFRVKPLPEAKPHRKAASEVGMSNIVPSRSSHEIRNRNSVLYRVAANNRKSCADSVWVEEVRETPKAVPESSSSSSLEHSASSGYSCGNI